MMPIATLTSLTATGDVVTGPGDPMAISNGLPDACLGDAVSGPVCVGAIVSTTSKVIKCGRPVATLLSAVSGVNPAVGVPVGTVVSQTVALTEIK